jgi:hypothetical protein
LLLVLFISGFPVFLSIVYNAAGMVAYGLAITLTYAAWDGCKPKRSFW